MTQSRCLISVEWLSKCAHRWMNLPPEEVSVLVNCPLPCRGQPNEEEQISRQARDWTRRLARAEAVGVGFLLQSKALRTSQLRSPLPKGELPAHPHPISGEICLQRLCGNTRDHSGSSLFYWLILKCGWAAQDCRTPEQVCCVKEQGQL